MNIVVQLKDAVEKAGGLQSTVVESMIIVFMFSTK